MGRISRFFRTARLARDIVRDTTGPLVCICVLKGGHQFFADLVGFIKKNNVESSNPVPLSLEFIRAKSYVNDKSSGKVELTGMDLGELTGKVTLLHPLKKCQGEPA